MSDNLDCHRYIRQSQNAVTALLVTYNHAKYVQQSFGSIIDQSISSSIDIVVSDDLSCDNTLDIVKHISDGFPNVTIRQNTSNLGVIEHYRSAIDNIDTEFVAILEGDDYWTDKFGLKEKLNFFRCRPELDCVFASYDVLFQETEFVDRRPNLFGGKRSGLVFFNELLEQNFIASFSNCMYRTNALRQVLSDEHARGGYDWLVNLRLADLGPIGYLERACAVYRVHKNGTWSGMTRVAQISAEIETLRRLRESTKAERHFAIDQRIHRIAQTVDGG